MLSLANRTVDPLHFLEMHLSLVEMQYWGSKYALCAGIFQYLEFLMTISPHSRPKVIRKRQSKENGL